MSFQDGKTRKFATSFTVILWRRSLSDVKHLLGDPEQGNHCSKNTYGQHWNIVAKRIPIHQQKTYMPTNHATVLKRDYVFFSQPFISPKLVPVTKGIIMLSLLAVLFVSSDISLVTIRAKEAVFKSMQTTS